MVRRHYYDKHYLFSNQFFRWNVLDFKKGIESLLAIKPLFIFSMVQYVDLLIKILCIVIFKWLQIGFVNSQMTVYSYLESNHLITHNKYLQETHKYTCKFRLSIVFKGSLPCQYGILHGAAVLTDWYLLFLYVHVGTPAYGWLILGMHHMFVFFRFFFFCFLLFSVSLYQHYPHINQ